MAVKKRTQAESIIERRPPDQGASRHGGKPTTRHPTKSGGLFLRSGRRNGRFGWRGPSPAGVSPFFG